MANTNARVLLMVNTNAKEPPTASISVKVQPMANTNASVQLTVNTNVKELPMVSTNVPTPPNKDYVYIF